MWVFSVFERELVVVESCFEFMFCHTNAGLCITRSCCESCFVDNVLGKARTVKNSQNVWTNIAKSFLCLIDKHFPKSNKLHKIFNRNNLKVSYSCTTNMANIIQSRNRKILNENDKASNEKKWNCRNKVLCPLDGITMQEIHVLPFTIYHLLHNLCESLDALHNLCESQMSPNEQKGRMLLTWCKSLARLLQKAMTWWVDLNIKNYADFHASCKAFFACCLAERSIENIFKW